MNIIKGWLPIYEESLGRNDCWPSMAESCWHWNHPRNSDSKGKLSKDTTKHIKSWHVSYRDLQYYFKSRRERLLNMTAVHYILTTVVSKFESASASHSNRSNKCFLPLKGYVMEGKQRALLNMEAHLSDSLPLLSLQHPQHTISTPSQTHISNICDHSLYLPLTMGHVDLYVERKFPKGEHLQYQGSPPFYFTAWCGQEYFCTHIIHACTLKIKERFVIFKFAPWSQQPTHQICVKTKKK